MCKCRPEIRTPFCGRPGCEWPIDKPPEPSADGDDQTPLCIATTEAIANELARRHDTVLVVAEDSEDSTDSSFIVQTRGTQAGALGLAHYFIAFQTTDRFGPVPDDEPGQ